DNVFVQIDGVVRVRNEPYGPHAFGSACVRRRLHVERMLAWDAAPSSTLPTHSRPAAGSTSISVLGWQRRQTGVRTGEGIEPCLRESRSSCRIVPTETRYRTDSDASRNGSSPGRKRPETTVWVVS